MQKAMANLKQWHHRHHDRIGKSLSLVILIIFIGLFALAIYNFLVQANKRTGVLIYNQVNKLASIIKSIDETAQITSFDLDKNYLNFLNVKSFAGSEIGSINLAHPQNWQGPYLEENMTIQGQYYYILKAANGNYYIVPGDGVKLSDGKVLGRDIIITPKTDIDALLNNEKSLMYEDKPLIVKLQLKQAPHLSTAMKVRLAFDAE